MSYDHDDKKLNVGQNGEKQPDNCRGSARCIFVSIILWVEIECVYSIDANLDP